MDASSLFTYRAVVERVVDGDTADLVLDMGFAISYRHSCRLFGINAPEHGTAAGDAAKAFLIELLPPGTEVYVKTEKDKLEKYGRILGTLEIIPPKTKKSKKPVPVVEVQTVNDLLVQAGHALPWDGKGARPI